MSVNLICFNPTGITCSSCKATQCCIAGKETQELVLQSGLWIVRMTQLGRNQRLFCNKHSTALHKLWFELHCT